MLILPFPPSTNRYWRHWQGRTLLSKSGREYRQQAVRAAQGATRWGSRHVAVSIRAYVPDARRRDLDNLLKATLDALGAARVYEDDSQVRRLLVEHAGIDRANPRLEITLEAA